MPVGCSSSVSLSIPTDAQWVTLGTSPVLLPTLRP